MSAEVIELREPAAASPELAPLAPWPAIDKYPLVIGPGLSLNYISSIFRMSLLGYRMQYVDLLDELLEKEPHGFAVLQKRVLSVAGGELRLTPANDSRRAKLIAETCQAWIENIPDIEQHLSTLAWASYYAIAGCEIHWQRDGVNWVPERLSFIHSRRLSFPVSGSWDLYIWDQGQMLTAQPQLTNGIRGLRIDDYPGKFIIHKPQIRGNYPTREGLGRQLAYWFALKAIASRGAPQYLERFARPWPEGTYSTAKGDQKPGRAADTADIAAAEAALRAMGAGTLTSWVHPDTVTLELKTPDAGKSAKVTFKEWIEICDEQISEVVLGNTLTTNVGSTGGNRALGDTQSKGEIKLYKHDARTLASSLKRDLLSWMVRLNWPKNWPECIPKVTLDVEDSVDPGILIERAAKAVDIGMPIDADELAEQAGLPLVQPDDIEARRLYRSDFVDPMQVDEDLAARRDEIGPDPNAPDPAAVVDPNAEPGDGEQPKPVAEEKPPAKKPAKKPKKD